MIREDTLVEWLLSRSDVVKKERNSQWECVVPSVIASKDTELLGATIDAPVENKPKGLWCGSHNDRGKTDNALCLEVVEKLTYNRSRRLK